MLKTQPRSWKNLIVFGLALSGLLVSLVLHLMTFANPALPTSLHSLEMVYPFIALAPIGISSLFRYIRYSHIIQSLPAPLPTDPFPSRRTLARAYWAEFRAAPPFARVIYGLGVFLFHYQLFLFFQACALLGNPNQDRYYLPLWTAIGIFNYLLVTVSAAGSLSWWGWWRAGK
jgi:hypothetical protein